MREIVLDTETTGLDPFKGHKIVEIGCIEIFNKVKTGRSFHVYLNPERDMPHEAYNVHGLSSEFLSDKPKFHEVHQQFSEFIHDAPLVIHNAGFDMKFLNYEFSFNNFKILNEVIDTLLIARKKFPGSPASLDALCKRFKIDASHRTKHGALLDAELLAEVYLNMMGGSQTTLDLNQQNKISPESNSNEKVNFKQPRFFGISPEEELAHQEFLKKIKNPIWS